jgi:ATP-dependent DNA helicase RecG
MNKGKKDIDHLILDILPDVLDDNRKANKVRNLIYSLSKKDQLIDNQGSVRFPKWVRALTK